MPHVNIKHFPKTMTPEQKESLVRSLTHTIVEHFDVPDGVVSIALEPIDQQDWEDLVVEPELSERQHLTIKEPNYRKS
ncbi:tautomerase family protein [Actinopolyspora mortivallis]|uniref:Tautomerase pptA n=1 Tax=Actinopolyspora mortivallis TaxID=33906 RepID=A0A2T0GW66_ACTMO|nr:tautomerase family protein [Actinopolyspora mortivallis]PRW63344.1 tautomerase pptA [Actinopolyspora mortivallis]